MQEIKNFEGLVGVPLYVSVVHSDGLKYKLLVIPTKISRVPTRNTWVIITNPHQNISLCFINPKIDGYDYKYDGTAHCSFVVSEESHLPPHYTSESQFYMPCVPKIMEACERRLYTKAFAQLLTVAGVDTYQAAVLAGEYF